MIRFGHAAGTRNFPFARRLTCMLDFPIEPPVQLTSEHAPELRSIGQAARFMEGLDLGEDMEADRILHRLEHVATAEEARDAADAFRSWLEGEGLLVMEDGGQTIQDRVYRV